MADDIIYVNKLRNIVYKDGEILETDVKKSNDNIEDTIFDIFSRLLIKNGEQRKAFYHVVFDKKEYTKSTLSKHLVELYGKSERTYARAIEYLYKKRIRLMHISDVFRRYGKINVSLDYNLSLLDLDNVKSIIIHIV